MLKIMVVDDEQDVADLFQQKFRKEIRAGQMEFVFATSGQAALDSLASEQGQNVKLAIVDVNMPGMSGLELLQIIKKKYASMQTYVITGYGDEESRRLAQEHGCDGYLSKPLDFDALKSKLLDII